MELRQETTSRDREQMNKFHHIILDEPEEIQKTEDYIGKATSLDIREDIDYESWTKLGKQLQAVYGSLGWWIGDWLNFGEHKWGEKYAQAVEITGHSVQTLKNYKWVASRIEKSRRRDELSFTHHCEVAALDEFTQSKYLNKAVNNHLSVKELREAVSGKKEKPKVELNQPEQLVSQALFDRLMASKSKRVTFEQNGQKLTLSLVQVKAPSEYGEEINELIGLFEPINPSFEQLYGRPAERAAMERMIKKHGLDKMRALMLGLPSAMEKPYMPRITTPTKLENKLGELLIAMKGNNGNGVVKIS